MPRLLLPRVAIAMVWIYQGFWCKLVGRAPQQRNIAEMIPFANSHRAHHALIAVGVAECFLGVWVLSGIRAIEAAAVQTLLLVSMNTVGLWWARRMIPDPVGMLLQNFAFVLLGWVTAGTIGTHAAGS